MRQQCKTMRHDTTHIQVIVWFMLVSAAKVLRGLGSLGNCPPCHWLHREWFAMFCAGRVLVAKCWMSSSAFSFMFDLAFALCLVLGLYVLHSKLGVYRGVWGTLTGVTLSAPLWESHPPTVEHLKVFFHELSTPKKKKKKNILGDRCLPWWKHYPSIYCPLGETFFLARIFSFPESALSFKCELMRSVVRARAAFGNTVLTWWMHFDADTG